MEKNVSCRVLITEQKRKFSFFPLTFQTTIANNPNFLVKTLFFLVFRDFLGRLPAGFCIFRFNGGQFELKLRSEGICLKRELFSNIHFLH